MVDGMASEIRHGPQPYEGILSVICEAFHCLPDEAERQDWRQVKAILDYRTAVWAVETFNDKHGGAIRARYPQLGEMMRDMKRAQLGAEETLPGDALGFPEEG